MVQIDCRTLFGEIIFKLSINMILFEQFEFILFEKLEYLKLIIM